MIRSKTTFVLGHGAAAELHFPGPGETLDRIAAALDFSRAAANQMTRDTAAILRHVGKLALAVFTLQSEQRSSVRAAPQQQGGVPMQTGEY